jgi:hypothetical protein
VTFRVTLTRRGRVARLWVMLIEYWFQRHEVVGYLLAGTTTAVVGLVLMSEFGLPWGLIAIAGFFDLVVVGVLRPIQFLRVVRAHERASADATGEFVSRFGHKGLQVSMPWGASESFLFSEISNPRTRGNFVVFEYGEVGRHLILPDKLFPGERAEWLRRHAIGTS